MSRLLDIKLIRESLVAMLLALVADSIAGYVMDLSVSVFIAVPGLLMMIPALIDMRGNVYGAFISRLGSALHLGEIENLKDKRVKIEKTTTKSLAYSAALIVGIGVGAYMAVTMNEPILVILLPAIILVTHIFTAGLITPFTAYIGVKTFKKGWNPDNVGVPLISSVGDLVSVTFIVLVSLFFIMINYNLWIVVLISLVVGIYVILILKKAIKASHGRKIYIESMPILIVVALLELITGNMWENNKIALVLLVLPPLNETLGNIGSVFSSRLTSFVYLGYIEPKLVPKGRNLLKELFSILGLSVIIYLVYSAFVFGVTFDIRAVAMVWLAAFTAIFILIITAYYLTVGSLKIRLDPDNVVVPVITTLADIIGTVALLFSYFLLF